MKNPDAIVIGAGAKCGWWNGDGMKQFTAEANLNRASALVKPIMPALDAE